MIYEEETKELLNIQDNLILNKLNRFIKVNFKDEETGLLTIIELSKDKELFNAFITLLNETPDDDLTKIIDKIIGLNLSFKYSQEELQKFFYYEMTQDEIEKLNGLNLFNIIPKIEKRTYRVKYITNVGYMFIGEGYLILSNGTEPIHYFANIYNDSNYFRNEILKKCEEKNVNSMEKANILKQQNENEVVEDIVVKIKNLPSGTEFTIAQFIDVDDENALFIAMDILKKLEEEGIKLKSELSDNAITGLPQNIHYIIEK